MKRKFLVKVKEQNSLKIDEAERSREKGREESDEGSRLDAR